MANDKEDHPRTHDEARALETVREDCMANLRKQNLSAKVFLISGRKRYEQRWEFGKLKTMLLEHIDRVKWHALVLTVNADSRNVIKQKFKSLYSRIYVVAGASAATAVIPLGLDIAVDMALVVSEIQRYVSQLSLDKKSLQKLSAMYKDFEDCIYSVIPDVCFDDTGMFAMTSLNKLSGEPTVQDLVHYGLRQIPIVGSVVAYNTTAATLSDVLGKMKEAALNVLDMIIKTSAKDLE